MTTRCFLYHRLDLNNELRGASSSPSALLPRPRLLLLLIPYQLFTAHNSLAPPSEQQSTKSKVNQSTGLMSFKKEEKLEH